MSGNNEPKIGVGYCQGMNYVAGLIILVLRDEEKSFWLLVCLLNEILPESKDSKCPEYPFGILPRFDWLVSANQKAAFESRCESYFSKTMEGLLTDCDVLKQLIINRFPDVGEHDEDQWNLVSVKESHFHSSRSRVAG